MTMGHRIAVLKDGDLQQVGTPIEVYDQPANLFVAQFIGTPPMNFLHAAVGEGGGRLGSDGFALQVPPGWRASTAGKDGMKVVVGIRPEHVVEPGRSPRGQTAPLELEVEIVETLGDELVVHGRIGEDIVVFKQDPHRAPSLGEKVRVQLELEAMHLFDSQTELRLAAAEPAAGPEAP
jgi:multiple sugar transport system ATP-binding protein